MQRVLLLTPDFPPDEGGIQRLIYNFVSYTRLKPTVVVPHAKGAIAFDARQAFRIVRVSKSLSGLGIKVPWLGVNPWLFSMAWKAMEVARREGPRVLVCGHVITAPIGYAILRLFGIPYVVNTYGLDIMGGEKLLPFLLKHALLVFVISEFGRKRALELGVQKDRIKKCPPGIDTGFFSPSVNPSPVLEKYKLQGRAILLTVSRLDAREKYKGHDETLRAMTRIVKDFPSLLYVIVGDGTDRRRLELLAERLDLEKHVLFTGRVPDAEVAQFYAACDIFIMASKEVKNRAGMGVEGFGIVFQEAAACGKPVIAGKSGGIADAVTDGITGLLVEPDARSIAAAISRLLNDENLRRRLGARARRRVVEKMDVYIIARQTEDILLSCLRWHSGRR